MITETNNISITATFDEARKHRYSLRREWDSSKKNACIIMSNASTADIHTGDLTSLLIQNNLSALGYGSVTCVNLFSYRCQKLDLSGDISELTNDDNTQEILRAVRESDICIVAIGSLCKTYKRAAVYQNRLFDLLRDCQDKIHVITAPDGTEGLHPLSAKLRAVGSWELIPYKLPKPPIVNKDAQDNTDKQTKTGKGTKKPRNSKHNENPTLLTSA